MQAVLDIRVNDAQRKAMETIDGPLLVIAGAGTGKTATLTARVAYLIDQGVPPGAILLLTFTRKAAHEMLDRAARVFGHVCYDVEGGTFHSFAHKLLRVYGEKLGLDTFSIIDQADVEEIITYQMAELGLSGKDSQMPSSRTARVIFGKSINWGMTIEDVVKKDYQEYEFLLDDLKKLYDEVDWYKVFHRLIDYDDMLVYAQRLLEDRGEIRSHLSYRHQFIMVDEYQDTNCMQARIVRLLADKHDNVMAVGDDAQSIYAFRGANYRNILDFPKQFPGTEIIPLEQNFRSVQPILDLTNFVIGQAKESFRKELYAFRSGGVLPKLVYCQDEQQQSEYIVQRIQAIQKTGMPLKDIAVLIRSSFHSYDLELELSAAGIPFTKVGGLKFLEARHVKDVLAYMRIVVNVKDSLAWMRLLTMIDGIGPKTARKIFEVLLNQPDPFHWVAHCPSKGKWVSEVVKLGELFLSVFGLKPAEQIERILKHYLPYLRTLEPSDQEFLRRQQGLDTLLMMAKGYTESLTFLTDLSLDPPNENTRGQDSDDDGDDSCQEIDSLTISTMHSAKGLEWPVVFVPWLTEGRFPSLYAYEDEDRLEEELRLLYVAATRARDELHLLTPTYYDSRAGMTFSKMSVYLEHVPEALYTRQIGIPIRQRGVIAAPEFAAEVMA